MLCEKCGKAPATVRIEHVVNGKKTTMYLCEECARDAGFLGDFFQSPFSINNLLSAFLGSQAEALPSQTYPREETRCPVCGMSYRDFAQVGRLGCSQCYDVFASNLVPLVKRIHGSDRHIGKTPAATNEGVQLRKDLDELKNKLAQAVSAEEYEKAAELRDQIRALEAEIRGEHD